MNMEAFMEELKDQVQWIMGEGYQVEIREFHRNNGIVKNGMCIMPLGGSAAPIIYMEEIYEYYRMSEASLEEVAEDVCEYYREYAHVSIPLERILQWDEQARSLVSAKLMRVSDNRETLARVPHRKFLDLALVYFVFLESNNGESGTILVDDDLMDSWGIEEEELYEQCLLNLPKNSPARIFPIRELMNRLMMELQRAGEEVTFEEPEEEEPFVPMFAVTNEERFLGAIVLFYPNLLEKFMEEFDWEEVYILPSSVHEMLVVPVEWCNQDAVGLQTIVQEANRNAVRPEEQLSDSVYHFSRSTGVLKRLNCNHTDYCRIFGLNVAGASE